MDLATENRIAAILMKEAAELRCQAQREGALAYLSRPTVRNRPNSRFLTATVRGVQQANRAVEVSEMWRLREKQIELDNRLRGRGSRNEKCYRDAVSDSHRSGSSSSCNESETSRGASLSSKKRCIQNLDLIEDEGLRDDEVDRFLHSRAKRGRGAVGSRMDETGPYLPSCPDPNTTKEKKTKKANNVVLGPEKPYYLNNSRESSDDDESRQDKERKARRGSSKRHSKKHKSKEKARDEKKKRKRKEKK